MLREIEGIADEPRTRRRWFHDDFFDLFVWQTDKGDIMRFQLCYGVSPNERALAWHREGGLFHDGAEAGDPAVVDALAERFQAAAQSLPRKVRHFVIERIREYFDGRLPAAARRKRFRREDWQNPAAH